MRNKISAQSRTCMSPLFYSKCDSIITEQLKKIYNFPEAITYITYCQNPYTNRKNYELYKFWYKRWIMSCIALTVPI